MTLTGDSLPAKSPTPKNGIYSTESTRARGILGLNQMYRIRIQSEIAIVGSAWPAQEGLEVANE